MAPHVDLVENRWSAGYQERVGRAFQENGHVAVRSQDPHYEGVVEAALPELGDNPEEQLRKLGVRFHSDYFFATNVHDDDECPFADSEEIPFRPQPVSDPVRR